jgi:hypothetical protein
MIITLNLISQIIIDVNTFKNFYICIKIRIFVKNRRNEVNYLYTY